MIWRRSYNTALYTIMHKEVSRFLPIWVQTIVPPAITMTLYFVIFGNLIGPRVGTMGGYTYMQYIAPGIIMMAIITNAYANVVSSFFGAKLQRHIEEILVAPVPNIVILAGYVLAGVARGLAVGLVVNIIALMFTDLHVHSYWLTALVALLTSTLFSICGLINAVYAQKFDDVSIVPTFVLTPLTYLGGVFYSIDLLPETWRSVSLANPVLYMINAFRYGILGVADIDMRVAMAMILVFVAGFGGYALLLLRRGTGIRS